jgi:protein phosphatase
MSRLVIDVAIASRGVVGFPLRSAGAQDWLAAPGSPFHGAAAAITSLLGDYDEEHDPLAPMANLVVQDSMIAPEYFSPDAILGQSLRYAHTQVRRNVYARQAVMLSAVCVQYRNWYIGHAGTNRVWLYRHSRLQQLTTDHAQPRMQAEPLVTRACGLPGEFEPQVRSGELEAGDVLLVTSHTVHQKLDGPAMISALARGQHAAQIAHALVEKTLATGVRDGATVIALCVDQVPPGPRPPVPAPPVRALPDEGEMIDRFQVIKRRRKGRLAHYYRAMDMLGELPVTLKFPDPDYMSDPELIRAFLLDEWVGRRLEHNPLLAYNLPIERGRRTRLYSTIYPVEGENLAQRVHRKKHLPVSEVMTIARQFLPGLDALHQQRIICRDIRTENLVLDKLDQRVWLQGYDGHRVAYWLGQGPRMMRALNAQYLAPELWIGKPADEKTDQYAAGVTIYNLLTGHFPYGRIVSASDIRPDRFRPPSTRVEGLPGILDDILLQACSASPNLRFDGVAAMCEALLEAVPAKNK